MMSADVPNRIQSEQPRAENPPWHAKLGSHSLLNYVGRSGEERQQSPEGHDLGGLPYGKILVLVTILRKEMLDEFLPASGGLFFHRGEELGPLATVKFGQTGRIVHT